MKIYKTLRYRVYPTREQEACLLRWQDTLRFLWNLAHEQRLAGLCRPRCERKYYSSFGQQKDLTELRSEIAWVRDVPRHASDHVLIELDNAWRRCFKRLAGQPRWKKKNRDVVSVCETDPKLWRFEDDAIVFPKLKKLRVVVHRPLMGIPKTCRLVRDVDQWFVCIVCELEIPDPDCTCGSSGGD